ncbi:ATP-binding protein [Streptomyces sp. NPDC058247]|uniref:ATP-binding protein n=1 Tax=Streptomyces sp. NPDC058247 TaxID=3346401 RepID=UPI0036EF7465
MTAMAEVGTKQYRQELTVDLKQLGRVRRIVSAHVRCWGWAPMVDAAVMCVTELLSNVSKHADSNECVLLLQSSPSGVRIVVSDDSPALPVVREPAWSSESGRGMFLLAATADAWGAAPTGSGKDVWCEIRRPSSVEATV